MRFARWTFGIAGIYGLLAIVPLYFLEQTTGRMMPPPINHPEYFYGFAGVTLAWQIAFLIIARDPIRYRLFIWPAIVEKFSFVAAAIVLFWQGRFPQMMIGSAAIDCVLGVLFVISLWTTSDQRVPHSASADRGSASA